MDEGDLAYQLPPRTEEKIPHECGIAVMLQ